MIEETMTIHLKLPDATVTAVPEGDGFAVTFNYSPDVLVRHTRPFTEKFTPAQFENLKRQAQTEPPNDQVQFSEPKAG
jgi:hypothetical protein